MKISIIVIVLALLVAVSFVAIKHNVKGQKTLETDKQTLEETLKIKNEWSTEVQTKMMVVIATNEALLLTCGDDSPTLHYKQEKERLDARFDLEKALVTGGHLTYDPAVEAIVYDFINLDKSIEDICSEGSYNEDEYIDLLHQSVHYMSNSMLNDIQAFNG